jgi:hypothetical protein
VKATLKAEKKKMIMILLTGVNFCTGNMISFVFQLVLLIPSGYTSSCLNFLNALFLNLSYGTPFFFYYFFNKKFKKETNNFLLFPFVKKGVQRVTSGLTTTTRG